MAEHETLVNGKQADCMTKRFCYHHREDIFAIHNGFSTDEVFKGNLLIGDLVLDVSTKGRVRGIELLNATAFFSDFGIAEETLQHLTNAELKTLEKDGGFFLTIILRTSNDSFSIPVKIAVPLEAPISS